MAKLDNFKTRLEHVIQLGFRAAEPTTTDSYGNSYYDKSRFIEFRASVLSLLSSLYGEKHLYYLEYEKNCRKPSDVDAGLGVLRSVKSEIDNGWLESVKGLVSAEVFTDFLEMADHLLHEGYKDPAAVMIGSVLEEHLRQLCQKNGVDTHDVKNGRPVARKADLLNAELTKAGVYNALDQKQVTAWLDLRNKAAHGKYGEYAKEQVELMHSGVLGFTARVS